MNNDSLIKSIGDIDPEFIKEARPDSRRRMWARVVPAAAAAVILLVGLLTLPKILWPRAEGNEYAAMAPDSVDGVSASEEIPESASAGGKLEGTEDGLVLGANPASQYGSPDYCLRRHTLEETVSNSDLIIHAECTDASNGRDFTFRVIDSYPVKLPETVELNIPSYYGTSLEGLEYSPKEGERSFLFFVSSSDEEGNERFIYNGVIQVLEDGTLKNDSISDLGDYTYDGLIKALPKLAENIGINSGD